MSKIQRMYKDNAREMRTMAVNGIQPTDIEGYLVRMTLWFEEVLAG